MGPGARVCLADPRLGHRGQERRRLAALLALLLRGGRKVPPHRRAPQLGHQAAQGQLTDVGAGEHLAVLIADLHTCAASHLQEEA